MTKIGLAKLSCNGEWFQSEKKKFQETILLVPFFGAQKKNLQRHAQFLNESGFDCVIFDLQDSWKEVATNFLSSRSLFGLKHVWADQVEALLNEIPGNKIIFSFSNPTASAIEAIARRRGQDVKGLVADSGPSGQLWNSMVNFFTHEAPLPTLPLKAAAATATTFLWHPRFLQVIHDDLKVFPENFRILSIRGWKDPLITSKMIDLVFDPHTQLDWQKLSLPEAGHLNGLKDFPEEYKPAVLQFLSEIATPIKSQAKSK
jgi:pimeloyl-ACP methyl ester carboxylesterase